MTVNVNKIENLVANEAEIVVNNPATNNKKKIDIYLCDEFMVGSLAANYAKANKVELTGVCEIGTITLHQKTEQENVEVLPTQEIEDQSLWINKPSKLTHKSKKTTASDKNALPAGIPISCWKFYGVQEGKKVIVIYPFNGKKKKDIIPLERVANNTTAKSCIEINGVKYTIERMTSGMKSLVG